MNIKIDKNTAIIFDLDDTLYNEIEYLKSAYKEIAETLDKNKSKELYSYMFSLYRCKENVFDIISKKYQKPKKNLLKMYREHVPSIFPFPGVLDFFEKIKLQKGTIGIITDGRKDTQMAKLKSLGIESYLSIIIISEEIGTEKPHENNYLIIEQDLDLKNYYYIADNLKKDFITPNKLGWTTVAVIDNGLNIHNDSYLYHDKKHLPNHFISLLKDISII